MASNGAVSNLKLKILKIIKRIKFTINKKNFAGKYNNFNFFLFENGSETILIKSLKDIKE
jgi:hypothetical protein